MSDRNERDLLLNEPPIIVYPTLAQAIGINTAVVLQQLHFLLGSTKIAKNKYNCIDGVWWVYNTYEEWRTDHFPWMSEGTIKNCFIFLEKTAIVRSMQSVKHMSDRTKWYTIDYDQWGMAQLVIRQKLSDGSWDKNCLMVRQNLSDDSSESTTEIPFIASAIDDRLNRDLEDSDDHDNSDLSESASNPPFQSSAKVSPAAPPAGFVMRADLPPLPGHDLTYGLVRIQAPYEWHISDGALSLCRKFTRGKLSITLDHPARLCAECAKRANEGPESGHDDKGQGATAHRRKKGGSGANDGQPKPRAEKAPRIPQPTDAMFDAHCAGLSDIPEVTDASRVANAWKAGVILHGDKKHGKTPGIIAYECARLGVEAAALDYVKLASDTKLFYRSLRKNHPDLDFSQPVTIVSWWDKFRNAQNGFQSSTVPDRESDTDTVQFKTGVKSEDQEPRSEIVTDPATGLSRTVWHYS